MERAVTIVNKLGLHARAAAKLVTTASRFKCDIRIRRDHREVSGKSIMGVMMLAAGIGAKLTLIAVGSDESEALDALETLIADKFGEEA